MQTYAFVLPEQAPSRYCPFGHMILLQGAHIALLMSVQSPSRYSSPSRHELHGEHADWLARLENWPTAHRVQVVPSLPLTFV